MDLLEANGGVLIDPQDYVLRVNAWSDAIELHCRKRDHSPGLIFHWPARSEISLTEIHYAIGVHLAKIRPTP